MHAKRDQSFNAVGPEMPAVVDMNAALELRTGPMLLDTFCVRLRSAQFLLAMRFRFSAVAAKTNCFQFYLGISRPRMSTLP